MSVETRSAIMPTYARYDLTLVRGEGCRVWDDAGNAYLDFAAGIASVPLGHSHPAWVEAVRAQAGELVHVSNLYSTGPQEALAARLAELSGFGGQTFFANSGAEANEAALKIARKHGIASGPGRVEVVALEGSFHGRTMTTLAATGQPAKHAAFAPMPGGFVHVPPDDVPALDAAVGDQTAAVLLEPVLGEGGVIPLDDDYLRAARRIASERGALLILDEVQTGVGRCGEWFAFRGVEGAEPDVFTLAKGLGNGLPIGACVAREAVAFGPGEHASTFGGGPVVCAAALAVLAAIESEGLLDNARARGEQLRAGLAGAPGVAAVRGKGLLLGVALQSERAGDVVRALIGRGALATEAGPGVVRVTPPLVVSPEECDAFLAAFAAAAGAVFA